MKNEKTMTKLSPAQAYALQAKALRRVDARDRAADGVIREDDNRIKAMFAAAQVPAKPKRAKAQRAGGKKTRWSGAELDLLIALYLKYVDGVNGVESGAQVVDEFQAQYPDRSAAAVVLGLAQIKGLDAQHPAQGMTDTSQALVDRLYAIDPVRFPGGVTREEKVLGDLDRLVAEVLAA